MAPEVVKQTAYTSKADIWSLGCLVVEMLTGAHPWANLTQMQAIFRVSSPLTVSRRRLTDAVSSTDRFKRATYRSRRYLERSRRFPRTNFRNRTHGSTPCARITRSRVHPRGSEPTDTDSSYVQSRIWIILNEIRLIRALSLSPSLFISLSSFCVSSKSVSSMLSYSCYIHVLSCMVRSPAGFETFDRFFAKFRQLLVTFDYSRSVPRPVTRISAWYMCLVLR